MHRSRSLKIALASLAAYILPSCSALAIASSAAFTFELLPRQASACGGDPSLTQCGTGFPIDFCCTTGDKCVPLNTAASNAVICCPAGGDCSLIAPVMCDASEQNATLHPGSGMHADPTVRLDVCGSGCCPLTYTCNNGECYAQPAATSPTPSGTSSLGGSSSTSASTVSSSTASTAPTGATTVINPSSQPANGDPAATTSAAASVSGSSKGGWFAGGIFLGLLLGGLITALILWCLWRRRKGTVRAEKDQMRQQPNGQGGLFPWSRPPHHRTISGPRPSSDANGCHRVALPSRSTPPRWEPPNDVEAGPGTGTGYRIHVEGPATPSGPRTPGRTPRIKSLWPYTLRSGLTPSPDTPKPTQSPLPAHLKRGTINGMPMSLPGRKISPLRALKKQKSFQSLRRQVTDATMRTTGSKRSRPDISRTDSTESIVVLMPSNEPYTPEHRVQRAAEEPQTLPSSTYAQRVQQQHEQPSAEEAEPSTSGSWASTVDDEVSPIEDAMQETCSSRYPSTAPATPGNPRYTLSKPPQVPPLPYTGKLDSPYTPSKYYGPGSGKVTGVVLGEPVGLRVERSGEKDRPMTTFSTLMESAGLRREDLLMGTDARHGQR